MRPHRDVRIIETHKHKPFCFVYSIGCSAVLLCSKLNFHWWLVRQCYSFSHYGPFTKTAGGQREYRGLHQLLQRRLYAQRWTLFVGRPVGAEWRRLHAVSGSRTHCRCNMMRTHTHTQWMYPHTVTIWENIHPVSCFLSLSHTPQGKSQISGLPAGVLGAIEVQL